ncbi:MAG: EamA family transporter, partial [Candidatus Binatia bacterium]
MNHHLQTGISFALLAGILWGIGPLLLKRGMTYSNVSTATLIVQYVSVITLTLIAIAQGELFRFSELPATALWAFVGAGAVGASFGKIFYYKGIDKVGASKSTSVKNSSPILTTILAMVLLGEKLTLPVAIGVLLIVIGILVLTEVDSKDKKRPSRIGYFFYPLMAALCFGINPVFKKIGITAITLPVLGAFITQSTALLMMLTAGRFLKIKPK